MSETILNIDLSDDIQLAQQGNHQAFGRLIEKTRNMVSSIALAIVKDIDNSEDVTQQVYIGVWQQLSSLKTRTSFLPWLRQMTRYKAINFLRDNKVKLKAKNEEADFVLSQFCDPASELDIALHRDQQSTILSAFIDDLPEESREIVLLYYREEQNSAQVAQLLEQSEANIRKKLSRVRQLLQEKILAKHGRLLLSTAPSVGLSSLVLAGLTTSTPAVAAAITSSATSTPTSGVMKFVAVLGGSMLGGLLAIIALRFSTFWLLKKITDPQVRQQVLGYRKHMTIWIVFGAILLICGYEFTQGWCGPVGAYLVFAVGVVYQVLRMQRFIDQAMLVKNAMDTIQLQRRKLQQTCGLSGIIFGVGTGFVCMLFGLVNSGRLLF